MYKGKCYNWDYNATSSNWENVTWIILNDKNDVTKWFKSIDMLKYFWYTKTLGGYTKYYDDRYWFILKSGAEVVLSLNNTDWKYKVWDDLVITIKNSIDSDSINVNWQVIDSIWGFKKNFT
jgi:hypothetical protein